MQAVAQKACASPVQPIRSSRCIPAVSQCGGKNIFTRLQKRCHIKGLVLLPEIISMKSRKKVFISGTDAVYRQLIKPQSAGIRPGGNHLSGQQEALLKYWVQLPVEGRRNPLCAPPVRGKGSLEPGRRAHCRIAVIRTHGYPPEIPPAGFRATLRLKPGAGW